MLVHVRELGWVGCVRLDWVVLGWVRFFGLSYVSVRLV